MQKIFLLANTSWNLYNFRKSLIKSLLKSGYSVLCVAPHDEYSKKLTDLGVEYINIDYDNSNKNPIRDLLLLYRLTKIFNKYNPNVVLSYTIKANIYGGLASQLYKIPFIANVSGLGSLFIKNDIISKFSLFLYKIGLRKADKIFFQNKDDYNLFKKNKIIKKQNTDILPGSGVDLNKFCSSNKTEERSNVIFLFASRLLKDKGIIECVEAIKRLKEKNYNVELQILGKIWPKNPSSIQKFDLDNWINSGLINYLGFTDDIRPYIDAADVVLLPSYREGMSRILLEAASMSKPIITTNVTGCKEIVENNLTGYLCKVRDSEDLFHKMLKITKLSFDERKKMGEKGREKMIREFDEKIVISKYFDTIEQICK